MRGPAVSRAQTCGEMRILVWLEATLDSAEIMRVECSNVWRNASSVWLEAALCGDRACQALKREAKCQLCVSAVNPLWKLAQKRGEMQIWCATVVANGVGSWKLRECVTLSKAEVEVAKVSNCRRRRGWRLPKRVTSKTEVPRCVTVAEKEGGGCQSV